jgi:AhpD family alkylhydroperoxidase
MSETKELHARIENPGKLLPGAIKPIQDLIAAAHSGGVDPEVLELVHMRASQINGCSFCVDAGYTSAVKNGMSGEKLAAIAAWAESPHFSEAERAALALAEEATRLSDRSNAVPDDVWNEAAKYFDDKQLASIVLWVAVSNLFNRVNVSIRQPAGVWG